MTDWTSGYVADIGYTYGYYNELNPLRSQLAFLNAGIRPPAVGTACELGFGQGMSVNLHAAATAQQWYATDFNPSQAAFAQQLAADAGSKAHLYDQAFAEFCQRTDLPDFDYIGLHGIWSWISDENRRVIADFVRRKLKVGGVLYISYNNLPGWSTAAPIRHLISQHAESHGASGQGLVPRIEASLAFAERLFNTNPLYTRANPSVSERLKSIQGQNRNYLAHEYFNRDWKPMYFSDMADWLQESKLNYACSAHLLDHLDPINLTPDQAALLNETQDPLFKETLRDYINNQQFRRDYWVKGPQRLSPLERSEALRQLRVILISPRADVKLKVTGSLGEADMNVSVYNPILDALADHKIHSLGELEAHFTGTAIGLVQLIEAALILVGKGDLALVQDDENIKKAKTTSDRINASLLLKARSSNDISYLSSPVIGGGVTVGRFEQLFLFASRQGKKTPKDWAAWTWDLLAAQGQRLLKEGKPLEHIEDNRAELERQAQEFQEKRLPLLKALQIA